MLTVVIDNVFMWKFCPSFKRKLFDSCHKEQPSQSTVPEEILMYMNHLNHATATSFDAGGLGK